MRHRRGQGNRNHGRQGTLALLRLGLRGRQGEGLVELGLKNHRTRPDLGVVDGLGLLGLGRGDRQPFENGRFLRLRNSWGRRLVLRAG